MPFRLQLYVDKDLRNHMARNIEIKASVLDLSALRSRVAALADAGPAEIFQDDTFFRCDAGRLKLRAFSDDRGELIFYRRTDATGPSESFYLRTETSAPQELRECLALAYGQVGRVEKQRTVFLVGRTRLHLDRVKDLGDFLELEVVLDEGDSVDLGIAEANALMHKLDIAPQQLVDVAYVDLLTRNASEAST